MKRLTITTIALLFLSLQAMNQEWAPIGTKWYYSAYSFGFPFTNHPDSIESIGDTVINGISCRILSGTAGCSYGESSLYTYGADNKVYIFNESSGTFSVLYDFAAETGESWTIIPPNPADSFQVKVDSVYTRMIDGHLLSVQAISTIDFYSYYSFIGEVYEGIGNSIFLYPQISTCDPWPGPIRCFTTNETTIHFDTIPCNAVISYISINESFRIKEIKIFPNPATSFITININEGIAIEEATIYNHLGQKALEAVPANNTVDVSGLKAGIYFIEVATKEWRGRTKIIKQ